MPPKQPVGSIQRHHSRKWTVQVPVGRDAATGLLVYQRATINGPRRDAEAYRAQILASVPPEKIAPLQRKKTTRTKKPELLLRIAPKLRLHRVELLDLESLHVRCAVCRVEWNISLEPGGGLPQLYWRCPGVASGACAGGFAPGPNSREIEAAVIHGVDGRPPIWKWTQDTVRQYHPAKLSDAELLAIWDRFDWSEPRYLLHIEFLWRGIWRHAFRRRACVSQARLFIETVESKLQDRGIPPASGTRAAAAIANAKIVEEGGLLDYLRDTVRGLAYSSRTMGLDVPERFLL